MNVHPLAMIANSKQGLSEERRQNHDHVHDGLSSSERVPLKTHNKTTRYLI